jgi:hypothetical protein
MQVCSWVMVVVAHFLCGHFCSLRRTSHPNQLLVILASSSFAVGDAGSASRS